MAGRAWVLATALVMLLGCVSAVQATQEEPVELGRRAVSPKVGRAHGLGEALGLKSQLNPNCMGSAVPACMRGSVDYEACKCQCPWNYNGDTCGTCNSGGCKNGGTMNTQLCRCTCLPGFSGDDCGTGSKCLHSGTLVGGSDTDHTVGTCTCTNQWQGDTCNQCALMCHNGASENAAECKCNCPANRKQPTCQQCQDPGCKNGGIFQDLVKSNGDEVCGCSCPRRKGWKGVRCGLCRDPGCQNGGVWNQGNCQCDCTNENWSDNKCSKCHLNCINGKNLDPKTCTCVDGATVSYNPCKVGCKHGTLDPVACTCACKPGFKGIFCDQCEVEKCFNEGVLEHDIDCKCHCREPFIGDTCKECPLDCGKHGTLRVGCAGCTCATSKSGKWTGNKCNKCEHAPCKNGGTLNHETCECDCAPGWGGDTCDACTLASSECKLGSKLDSATCKCDCSQGKASEGDWGGQLCDRCDHQGCKNFGEVNPETCRCQCVPSWRGRYCEACGHEFCVAMGTGIDKRDKNSMLESRANDPACLWVRGDLGCPSGQN